MWAPFSITAPKRCVTHNNGVGSNGGVEYVIRGFFDDRDWVFTDHPIGANGQLCTTS